MRTNIDLVIGKKMCMEVAEDVKLIIEVLNDKEVKYQFAGEDGTKDEPVVTKLEVVHDDIFGVEDYSFWDGVGTRFFLFQFEPIFDKKKTINWLEENKKHGFFKDHPENDMDFKNLSDKELEWYFYEWVIPDWRAV